MRARQTPLRAPSVLLHLTPCTPPPLYPGVFVEGLSEWVVRSPQEIYGLMERGGLMRATGSTKLNELSSRSHAVFIIIAEQSETTYVVSRRCEVGRC